jgi:tripartite-type tricarboxylate transporter receptor subunit TctC
VTSKEPLAALPDVPPAAETMNGFEFVNFYGLAVPKGTPPEVIEKIRAATAETVADPKVGKQLSDLGFVLVDQGPADFTAFLEEKIAAAKDAVAKAGIEPK